MKDAFKEEQQKLYSKVLVGDKDKSNHKCPEDQKAAEDKSSKRAAKGQ